MLTPQEVASRSFAKATLGGYNLAQVDEFLDTLTEDYTALYNENTILKNKLKVLSETVEEYRATDNAMRKTLLAAQQMAEAMMDEAKRKRDELIGDAEQGAHQRTQELQKAVAAEEYRLKKAQESTASYVRRLAQFHDQEMEFLSKLGDLVPPELMAAAGDDPSADIKAALDAQVRREEAAASAQEEDTAVYSPLPGDAGGEAPPPVPPIADELELELDPDATRRYSDLQFGKDYKIE